MLDGKISKVERIVELVSNSGKKEQFRVGDTVDVNYVAPFDPRGVGFNGERGGTGKIVDIKDEYIYVDESKGDYFVLMVISSLRSVRRQYLKIISKRLRMRLRWRKS